MSQESYRQALKQIKGSEKVQHSINLDVAHKKLLSHLKTPVGRERTSAMPNNIDLQLITYNSSQSVLQPDIQLKTDQSLNSGKPSHGIHKFKNFMSQR
jgi:hypothetical protein